jgi:hypothetical protein
MARWAAPDGGSAAAVTHLGSRVTVLLSRIPTPVANTTVLVEPDGFRVYGAAVPPWDRGRLLSALRAGGFEVTCETHWLANELSRVR